MRRHARLRYVEFSIGYGTRHYGNGGDGTRNVVAGLSQNLGELPDAAVFGGARRQGGLSAGQVHHLAGDGTIVRREDRTRDCPGREGSRESRSTTGGSVSPVSDRPPMLFAPGSSRALGERVSARLGIALAPLEEREFEDGEHKARPLASVRGSDVFVLHSLFGEPGQSANDKLCRLLFLIGALGDAGAARVTALVPYLAYARKDRRTRARDPVTTRYVAALFEAVGTAALVTADVHNPAAFQNAFRCGAENLDTAGLFVDHFAPLLGQREAAVVAPDTGAVKRAEGFRLRLERALGRPVAMAIAEKHRSGGVVSGELLVGDVNGRDVLIVDDLVSSGTTLARAARACRDRGAATVSAAATHGLFAAGAPALLAEAGLERIAVTDTVWPVAGTAKGPPAPVAVLGCDGLFAGAVRCIHEGGSIAAVLEA